jgi:hypothetical protein
MRRFLKRMFGLGLLAGVAFALWRAWNARVPRRDDGMQWESAPFPFPPAPRPSTTKPAAPATTPVAPAKTPLASVAWVEPNGDGGCPATHPVKAKVKSGIFHEPGGANYERTKPDRCYLDATAAEADGLRRSKH